MLCKTEGVVLTTTKYNDRYFISQIFTKDFGKISYLIPNTKTKKSRINQVYFAPLSILNIEVEHLPLRQIQKIKDVELKTPLHSLRIDFNKVSISFFLVEFLSKVLQEYSESDLIYDFIKNSVLLLEDKFNGLANFHIVFLLILARLMGIYPDLNNHDHNYFFDLVKGGFTSAQPLHSHYVKKEQYEFLTKINRINFYNMHLFKMSKKERNEFLDYIIDYYRIHVYDFSEIKSLSVLRSFS